MQILTFVDDFSRKIFVYFLKSKNEVSLRFKEFQNFAEKQSGRVIKILQFDNGKEYVNHELEKYLKEEGTHHQLTIPYMPEQNGIAERTNRIIVKRARCLIQDAKYDKRLWAEAVNCAVYLKK